MVNIHSTAVEIGHNYERSLATPLLTRRLLLGQSFHRGIQWLSCARTCSPPLLASTSIHSTRTHSYEEERAIEVEFWREEA